MVLENDSRGYLIDGSEVTAEREIGSERTEELRWHLLSAENR